MIEDPLPERTVIDQGSRPGCSVIDEHGTFFLVPALPSSSLVVGVVVQLFPCSSSVVAEFRCFLASVVSSRPHYLMSCAQTHVFKLSGGVPNASDEFELKIFDSSYPECKQTKSSFHHLPIFFIFARPGKKTLLPCSDFLPSAMLLLSTTSMWVFAQIPNLSIPQWRSFAIAIVQYTFSFRPVQNYVYLGKLRILIAVSWTLSGPLVPHLIARRRRTQTYTGTSDYSSPLFTCCFPSRASTLNR